MRRRRFLAPWQREDLELHVHTLEELDAEALLALRGKPALYHCISRVVNRDRVLGPREREHFVTLLRLYERFCRVRVLSYAVLSNHFHLLLEVPARPETDPSDAQLLKHLSCLYSPAEVRRVEAELGHLRAIGAEDAAEALRQRFLSRMYDLSAFMKILKQRFSQWFNREHGRRGTLWEDRFKSTLVEDGHAARVVAAYIDLNPVRAGMIRDPKDYRWCSYGEAVAGGREAREGLRRVVFEELSARTSSGRAARESASWRRVHRSYREQLFLRGQAAQPEHEGGTRRTGTATFHPDHVREVLDAGGELSEAQMLRCRIRYLTDGLVIGARAFVESNFLWCRDRFPPGRRNGARPIRKVRTSLHSMRDLKREPLGRATP